MRIRLGDMLVQARIVEPTHIDEALAIQKQEGGRLGAILVELGYVSEMQLAQVLSNQLSVPWVNLYHVDFSRELLNLVPAEVAEQYACIPVYVRKVRNQGETLFVATDDPLNDRALAVISEHAGKPVKPMVASSSDVRNAIRVYYFGGKPSAGTAPPKVRKPASIAAPPPVRASIPPVELEPAELEEEAPPSVEIPKAAAVPSEARPAETAPSQPSEPRPTEAQPTEAQPMEAQPTEAQPMEAQPMEAQRMEAQPMEAQPSEAGAQPPARAPEPTPAAAAVPLRKKKKKPAKMITLTLLDGTTVKLPAPGEKPPEEEEPDEGLTTRDLIAALIARAEGKDVSKVLPEARWEPLMAALLSLLLKKGLIADWEFVEEWRKHRR